MQHGAILYVEMIYSLPSMIHTLCRKSQLVHKSTIVITQWYASENNSWKNPLNNCVGFSKAEVIPSARDGGAIFIGVETLQ